MELTKVVFINDEKTGDVTAYYSDCTHITAQGRSEQEAKELLDETVFAIYPNTAPPVTT